MATLSLQRSEDLLQKQGFHVWIAERWNPWAHKRQDMFGFADLLAIKSGISGVTAVQATGEDIHSHLEKMLPNPYLKVWLEASNQCFVWAWRKRGSRGERKTWQLREIEMVLKDGRVVAQETGAEA
jgi:hypothetical protein